MALTLTGCSGIRSYPNQYEKNALVRVRTEPGTLLSNRAIHLDLYTVDGECHGKYLGSLDLDNGSIGLGLPLDDRVLLAYVFARSSIIGTSASTAIQMMLTPQRGHRYEFDVSYLKKGYTATGLDFAPGQVRGRDIEHARLDDCKPDAVPVVKAPG
jgi:hypothetical protein